MIDLSLGLIVCLSVCLFVSPSLPLVHFGQLLSMQINALLIVKVYTERNNMQVELIRYRKKVDFFTFTFAADSMQYRPTNAYQEVLNTNHLGHCHF